MNTQNDHISKKLRYVDLFCGIGGFRFAIEAVCRKKGIQAKCVFSCEIDEECRKSYLANFSDLPNGDITKISEKVVPDHEILLAGFPCQPFSIIGKRKGFEDARGTLFFDIARIIQAKQPTAFVLENVKLLYGHNGGKTLARILETLQELGYYTDHKVLNALDFGLPQKRERIFIVGFKNPCCFDWPIGRVQMKPLSEILEKDVHKKHYASERIRKKRLDLLKPTVEPTIWHENKAGHISAYPFSCALRAGASYNYLLVNGERRLTPREMLRLQGFQDSFKIVCNDSQARKQAGNSLPVPVAAAVIEKVFEACGCDSSPLHKTTKHLAIDGQFRLFEKKPRYNERPKIKNCRKIQTALPTKSVSK